MSLWKVAWRSIQQRALASALTAFSMGLGVALVVAVLVIYSVVEKSFRRGSQGYDLIVGAKGGQLELVLNTVFYLGAPVENIPYEYYEEFTIGHFETAVETAIPICMGHAYKGVPVVATVPEMFDQLKYLGEHDYKFLAGENFAYDDHYGAVIGWEAARKAEGRRWFSRAPKDKSGSGAAA
jgi:putative ABC transport system permease protein